MSRIVRSTHFDDGRDRWSIAAAVPDARLAGAIDGYGRWTETTTSFTTRRELAATTGTLLINLAADLEIVDAGGGVHRLGAGQGFVAGPAQATSLSRSTGPMAGVHVRAPMTTLAQLAGVPIAELTNRVVMLGDLPGFGGAALGERLMDACEEAGWALLDRFVAGRLADAETVDPATAFLLARLSSGARVQSLADALAWSRKRLAEHFRDATGLLPRCFAGLARFERFAAALQAEPDVALAEAAVAAGYADQAHLTREVVRFAGETPAALRRRLIPAGGGVRD
jgi:AraC-like DNA-binding protein